MELDFLKNFIDIGGKIGVNDAALRQASLLTYGNENAYLKIFYDGITGVLSAIEDSFDEELENIDLSLYDKVTEKVSLLLKKRIYGKGDRSEFYRQLSRFYLSKAGYSQFFKNGYKTVDKIWRLVGDNSLNWSYYSKRAILFGVYCSSMRYYVKTQECSPENLEEKINQRLAKVRIFNKFKKMMSPSNIPFIRLLRK